MVDVTVIILTKNEEKNLPDCLDSLDGFAKRVVVVDSFSTDQTKAIALERGADFYENKFVNYAKQFNWGIDNTSIKTKWTMRLDADERLTPELKQELTNLTTEHEKDDINGVVMESWLYFLGKRIKHGCHNKRKLMLFKTGFGRIEDIKMDERTILFSGSTVFAKNRFIHYDFKNLSHWVSKMNWYATREMQDYYDFRSGSIKLSKENYDRKLAVIRKKKFGIYYHFPLFIRCWLLFVYYYFFRFGFLDGKEGFVYHWMYHRWYRTLVDSKILEHRIMNEPFEETGDLK